MIAIKNAYTTYTHLEDYIYRLYSGIDIFTYRQLDHETIGNRLGLCIDYLPIDSIHEGDTIILDSRLSNPKQWQDFGHELYHAILDIGNQLNTPPLFKEYQEWKANNFAYHACVPTFMLERMDFPKSKQKAVWMIQEKFHVERQFAEKRLYQYLCNYKKFNY